MIIANSALHASLAIYHLISNARARGIIVKYVFVFVFFKGSGPPSDQARLTMQLMTISPALYGVTCAITVLCIMLAVCFLAFNIKLRHYR